VVATRQIANIGPAERRKRQNLGLLLLAASLAVAVVLIAGNFPRGWRLLLIIPLWAAALGVFQARERT
jgi:hypothetical protein